MKILVDVNYCPVCDELSCELTASVSEYGFMESSLFCETLSDLLDNISLIVNSHCYKLDKEVAYEETETET